MVNGDGGQGNSSARTMPAYRGGQKWAVWRPRSVAGYRRPLGNIVGLGRRDCLGDEKSSRKDVATDAAALNPLAANSLNESRELVEMTHRPMEQFAEMLDHVTPVRGLHAPFPQYGIPRVRCRFRCLRT